MAAGKKPGVLRGPKAALGRFKFHFDSECKGHIACKDAARTRRGAALPPHDC